MQPGPSPLNEWPPLIGRGSVNSASAPWNRSTPISRIFLFRGRRTARGCSRGPATILGANSRSVYTTLPSIPFSSFSRYKFTPSSRYTPASSSLFVASLQCCPSGFPGIMGDIRNFNSGNDGDAVPGRRTFSITLLACRGSFSINVVIDFYARRI